MTVEVRCATLLVRTLQAQVSLTGKAVSLRRPTRPHDLRSASAPPASLPFLEHTSTVLPQGLCTLLFLPGMLSSQFSLERLPPSYRVLLKCHLPGPPCQPPLAFTSPPATSFLSIAFIITRHTMDFTCLFALSPSPRM